MSVQSFSFQGLIREFVRGKQNRQFFVKEENQGGKLLLTSFLALITKEISIHHVSRSRMKKTPDGSKDIFGLRVDTKDGEGFYHLL